MTVNRTTHGVQFNVGISNATYSDVPAGLTQGTTQQPILPGSTTVTEALAAVFPKDPTVAAQILQELAQAGNSTLLRTPGGFRGAARKAIRSLREGKGRAAAAAAGEIEELLEDTELLDMYRAALLES